MLAKRFMTPSGLVIRIFLASALLFFLLGCRTSDTPSTDGEATEAAPVSQASGTPVPEAELTDAPTPAGGPRYGGVVNIQKHGPPGKLDPHPSVAGLDASEFAHVYDNLVQYNPFEPTDEIVSDLAESWDISDDGLVFTFHLQDHVVWTDGNCSELMWRIA